jgi:antiviral helicase SKI2
MQHDEWIVKENISQLRQLMSDQNLQLLPDYEQRISVLKDLEFITGERTVGLKGKVACEIHSVDELVLTQLVLENVLSDYEPEEVVALLSAFVFQEKTDNVPVLTASLEKGREAIIRISEDVNRVQTLHQVILSSEDSNDFVSRPRFGLVEVCLFIPNAKPLIADGPQVVYEWARGMSFNRITDLTDVMEVRNKLQTASDSELREIRAQ